MMLVAFVIVILESFVDPFALTVKMAVDLGTLFLEVVGFAIVSLIRSTIGFAFEFLLNTVTHGIQASLDAISLGRVTVMVAAAVPSFSQSVGGEAYEQEGHCDWNDFFHGFVLSFFRVAAMLLLIKTVNG
jgi:hypothetical protein